MKSKQTKKQRKVSQESVCNNPTVPAVSKRFCPTPLLLQKTHYTDGQMRGKREPKGPQKKKFWLQALDNNPASVVVQGIGVGGTVVREKMKIGGLLLYKNNWTGLF
jgi:hypothetical protein